MGTSGNVSSKYKSKRSERAWRVQGSVTVWLSPCSQQPRGQDAHTAALVPFQPHSLLHPIKITSSLPLTDLTLDFISQFQPCPCSSDLMGEVVFLHQSWTSHDFLSPSGSFLSWFPQLVFKLSLKPWCQTYCITMALPVTTSGANRQDPEKGGEAVCERRW